MQPVQIDWSRRAEPVELPELMDEPCTYEEFSACLRDLAEVNRVSLGYKPTLAFLTKLVTRHKADSPLRILDVGCGGGDGLRRISRWAAARKAEVVLIGIDISPFAAKFAREVDESPATVTYITGDAFSYQEPVDVVLSSLFTHHLPSAEIVRFLAWMETKAKYGWFINDLERSPASYRGFSILSRIFRWHRFVQHDGPVSFRRSFCPADWLKMLEQAGVPLDGCSIEHHRPGRLCVSRWK